MYRGYDEFNDDLFGGYGRNHARSAMSAKGDRGRLAARNLPESLYTVEVYYRTKATYEPRIDSFPRILTYEETRVVRIRAKNRTDLIRKLHAEDNRTAYVRVIDEHR